MAAAGSTSGTITLWDTVLHTGDIIEISGMLNNEDTYTELGRVTFTITVK